MRRFMRFFIVGAVFIACASAQAVLMIGGRPQDVMNGTWPADLQEVLNCKNYAIGFCGNGSTILYYNGTATDLNRFLEEYSHVQTSSSPTIVHYSEPGKIKHWGGSWPGVQTGRDGDPCEWKVLVESCRWKEMRRADGRLTETTTCTRVDGIKPVTHGTYEGRPVTVVTDEKQNFYDVTVSVYTGAKIRWEDVKVPVAIQVLEAPVASAGR